MFSELDFVRNLKLKRAGPGADSLVLERTVPAKVAKGPYKPFAPIWACCVKFEENFFGALFLAN